MSSKTKIILTIIGLGAIVIPAVLLLVFSGNKVAPAQNSLPTGTRQIDKNVIQKGVQQAPAAPPASPPPAVSSPTPSPVIIKTPTPNLQGTPSGVN